MKLRYFFPLFFCYLIAAQKNVDPDKIKQFNITVNQEEQIVKTQILKNPKKIHAHDESAYVWYTANQLVETKGGYDGKLVHGYYKAFFFSNQLKESGHVRYGLKTKEWRYWYSNGNLREIIHWKKGLKNGAYVIYNDQGKRMAKGRFKNDLLHGKFYTYGPDGKISEKKKYRHGNECIKNQKKVKEPRKKNRVEKIDQKENNVKKEKKIKRKKKDESLPEEIKPLQDTTHKPNIFQRLFKKKKKEQPVENPPNSASV